MKIEDKRVAVRGVITQFLADKEPSQIPAQAAYELLYADDVDFALFHSVWQHVQSGAAEEAAHAELLKSAAPADECQTQPTAIKPTLADPQARETQ